MAKQKKQKKIGIPIPPEVEQQARAEAGNCCCIPGCGAVSDLKIHHVDGNPGNHSIGNLLVLCAECFAKARRGEIDRKSCRAIKHEISIRGASPGDLEDVKDEIIGEMRRLINDLDEPVPLDPEDKDTAVPDMRVTAVAGQAITLENAGVHVPVGLLRGLVESLYDTGEFECALVVNRLLAEAEGATLTDRYNLGILLDETGHADDAQGVISEVLAAETADAREWYNLGLHLGRIGRVDDGVSAFRKAIAANPKDASRRNSFAYMLWEHGRLDEAEAEITEALRLDPDDAYANATMALLQLEKNDLDAGRAGYEKAIELEPEDKPLAQKYHFEYGRALARNARTEEARQEFQAAQKVRSDYISRERIQEELSKLSQ